MTWVWTISAVACEGSQNMPGQQIDVRFARDSATVSVDELARLSAWSAAMQRYKIIDYVVSSGLAEAFEKNPRALAEQRARKVLEALRQFGVEGDELEASGRVYKAFKEPRGQFDEGGQRVEVTLSPGCPNHCCSGH
jgi:hypothetical protein